MLTKLVYTRHALPHVANKAISQAEAISSVAQRGNSLNSAASMTMMRGAALCMLADRKELAKPERVGG